MNPTEQAKKAAIVLASLCYMADILLAQIEDDLALDLAEMERMLREQIWAIQAKLNKEESI
jgi:hypothetical protein